jgi:hypothetical protein
MLKRFLYLVPALLILMGLSGGTATAQIVLPGPYSISTIAGNGGGGTAYSGNGGPATYAVLPDIIGVAVDSIGNAYIADGYNSCILKVSKDTGIITNVVGPCSTTGYGSYTLATDGDGGPAISAKLQLNGPIAVDQAGNLYFEDSFVNVVRKVVASTGTIETIAGNGTVCEPAINSCGDGGPGLSAELGVGRSGAAIAVDLSGNVYFWDGLDSSIRKLTVSTGIVTRVVGTGLSSGSGNRPTVSGYLATSCSFVDTQLTVSGIAVDSSGNIYFVTGGDSNYVYEVNASTGILNILAGTGMGYDAGDGGLARSAAVNNPTSVAVDLKGNVYFAEEGSLSNSSLSSNRVRFINAASGVITTIAGGVDPGFRGDGGLATSSLLSRPEGIALDSNGNIYVADTSNGRVRVIGASAVSTTTTVSTSDSSIYYGATVTFTATVTATSGTPTGTVTFYSDGNSIGTATLSSGSGSITNSTLAIGTHSITASYAQNAQYLASTSAPITQTITMVPTSINGVSVSPNPAVVTNPVVVSAYVSASNGQTPTGTMTLQVDGNTIGTPTLSNGAGSASISSLAVGSHSLGISYGGSATFDSSSVFYDNYITISQITTSISVTASTASASFGQCVNFTANVTSPSGTPTGTVAFTANATGLGSATLSGGVATVSNCTLPVGAYTITASYSGATNFKPISGTTTFTVTKAPTTLSWNPPAAITYGTALSGIQLDATVVNGIPGTLTYTPAAGTVLDAGIRTLSVTFTPTDTADYAGSSASVSLLVNKATPTISWASPAPIIAGTALSSAQLNASASVAGTYAYTPGYGTVLPAGNQTLSVTFTPTNTTDYNNATASVTMMVKAVPTITWPTPAPITYGTPLSGAQLDATASVSGTYAYTPGPGTVLQVGNRTLSVTFTPTDGTDYSTATASVVLTVSPATPTILWPTPAAITYGTVLSSLQLDATTAGSIPGTFIYTPAAGAVLPAGNQLLSVVFHPTDASDYTTASGSTILVVNKAGAVVTGTSSLSQSIYGDSVTETFTVAPVSNGVTPTGTITLMDGATELTTLTLTNGRASYTTSVLTAGTHSITASYNGDQDYQ